jgi:hypothetical protein
MKLYKQNEDGSYEEAKVIRAFQTQEDLDTFMKDRVSRAEEKAVEKYADYDTVKSSLEDANKKLGEFETTKKSLEEQLQEKSKEVEKATLNTTRVEVRNEFGLSKDLDKFLVGDTEEDIRSNAEILKKNGGAAGVTFNKDDPSGGGAKESASKTLANGLFGSKE